MSQAIFVDSGVSHYETLLANISSDCEVFIVNSGPNGLEQMASILEGYSDLSAIHLISHGSEGALFLGDTVVTEGTLATSTSALTTIGQALAADGDILLYGCNVAKGKVGKDFLQALSSMTGADVAALDDATGAALLGGDWQLEQAIGLIETTTIASGNFAGVLDVINGTSGNDNLVGTSGSDTILAGAGDDTINAGAGYDEVDGGAGFDVLTMDVFAASNSFIRYEFTSTTSSEYYNLYNDSSFASIQSALAMVSSTQRVFDTSSGSSVILSNIERLLITGGGAGQDLLICQGSGSAFHGGTQGSSFTDHDTFYADWSSATTAITWVNAPTTTQAINGFTVSGLERLLVATGSGDDVLSNLTVTTDDTLITGSGNDTVNAGAGDDIIDAGEGNDILNGGDGIDTLIGGTGNDTYYVDNASDVTSETSTVATEIDTVVSTFNWTLGANIEKLTLSGISAINGTGNALNNTLVGNSAANVLNGGTGIDTMIGGLGNDTYYVDNASDVTTESSALATEIDTVVSSVTRTLGANLERLTLSGTAAINGTGNSLNNTLVGNSGANLLNGSTGIDTMIGGLGNDTYDVDNASDVTTESSALATEIDTVVSSVTRTLGANLERLTLSGTAAINGTGNTLNNTLVGNSAANVLNGGTGIDTMIGGTGNDTYYVDNAGDVTTENSTLATEIDTVVSTVTRTLGANLEKLTLSGTAAINGTGNALNNTLVGNSAANVLNGGTGIDTMIGGLGNDTYYVDNASDVTTESSTLATEIDTVVSTVTRTLGTNLEKLVLTGTVAINGTGNTLNNTLVGNSAANVLNGGTGIDTMIGGLGNDTYYVDNASDVTTESSTLATEIDTVVSTVTRTLGANIEKLTLSGTSAINGTGNTLNNTLVGNSAANVLNGGTGIDTMIGGLGNDTYYVDNVGDITTETSTLATEIDTVVSSVSRTLGANLERLTLSGTATINGTGNTLNNTLTGNTAANVLNGNSGNDVLNGGLGNDTLIGGAGIDTFVFDSVLNATTNRDTLADFTVVDDTLRLDRTVFAKLTTLGGLNTAFFRSSATGAAADSNDYLLYNTSTGALAYDTDGNGAGSAIQFATLTTKPSLTAADFVVVA